jgi:hypothetical protein
MGSVAPAVLDSAARRCSAQRPTRHRWTGLRLSGPGSVRLECPGGGGGSASEGGNRGGWGAAALGVVRWGADDATGRQ